MGMTNEELETLEDELIDLQYKLGVWTQEDLDRQSELVKILTEAGAM